MDNNNLNNQEIQEEKRKRRLATLKASNELLRQAKESALKRITDPVRRADIEEKFNKAINENNMMGRTHLNATKEEIENSEFREVDPYYVKDYNERLRKKGITDEDLHRKDLATIVTGKNKKAKKDGQSPRRVRKGAKKDESEIVRLENEEEIMKSTMVKSDKDIEENIKKNREFEQNMSIKNKDVFEKLKENIKESSINDKITVLDNENVEHVKVQNVNSDDIIQQTVQQNTTVVEKKPKKKKIDNIKYDFDFSSIPSWVQYDVIPLPSNGMCYPITSPLRCGRVPVAYLTAADENILLSPNAYRDGKVIDIILDRKILDKRVDVSELSSGDRDAIVLWLRATSYGDDFPIMATNPQNGKEYRTVIKLSQFEYNDFDLEGDENGLFDYKTSNGDKIKFKFFTNDDEEKLRNVITSQITDTNKIEVLKSITYASDLLSKMNFDDEDKTMLDEDINEIKTIVGSDIPDFEESIYPNTVTEQMIMHTVSVNGNTDREFIENYIENMRTKEAMDYRNYFVNNKPGVDFNFEVNIPESDGGGSFATFLRLEDNVFINV